MTRRICIYCGEIIAREGSYSDICSDCELILRKAEAEGKQDYIYNI